MPLPFACGRVAACSFFRCDIWLDSLGPSATLGHGIFVYKRLLQDKAINLTLQNPQSQDDRVSPELYSSGTTVPDNPKSKLYVNSASDVSIQRELAE